MKLSCLLKQMLQDARGATAVEYGLILGLIVIACIAAINNVGGETAKLWIRVQTKSAEAHGGA